MKPAFWTNEKLAATSDFTRLLAIALLNYADDHGYFWANPIMIRGALFPFDEDSTRIRRSLVELSRIGYLRVAKCHDGREAGEVIAFKKHQRVDRPQDSEISPLVTFDDQSTNDLRLFDDDSSLDRKGKDRKGKDTYPAPAEPRKRNALLDSLASVGGCDPEQATGWANFQKLLKEIQAVCPNVTAEEIRRRELNFAKHYPTINPTPNALVKWWSLCDKPPTVRHQNAAPTDADHAQGF